jgi:uncharacterized ferritin-like protein (DUF455 family)
MENIYKLCADALMENDFAIKCQKVNDIYHKNNFNFENISTQKVKIPGKPELPNLVRFAKVPKRTKNDVGMINTIHAITHIEFNAINLALDAAYRFQNIDKKFTLDWIKVAFEEAKHFNLLNNYLIELGYKYGDFDAHNGLWRMTYETDYDPLVRMALVPRVLEARGLDATPAIMKRFKNSKFDKMVDILQVIYDDEIGHVQIGNYWYKYLCDKQNLDYMQEFDRLCKKHIGDNIRGPFNIIARLKAGFTQKELDFLELNSVN